MPTPPFLDELDAAIRAGEHVLAEGNLHDLHLMPFDGEDRPLALSEAVALHFERSPDPVATMRFSLGGGLETVRVPGELRRSTAPEGLPEGNDPVVVLPAMTRIMRRTRCVLVLAFADFYLPSQEGPLAREHAFTVQTVAEWGLDPEIRRRGSLVVILSPEGRVHPLLTRNGSGFRSLTIPLPSQADRRRMFDQLHRAAGRTRQFAGLDPSLDVAEIARHAGGLRLVDLFRLSRQCRAEGTTISRNSITARKAAAISEQAGGVLEVHGTTVDPTHISGLGNVTGYVNLMRASGALPRGILLVGPPGTGKSMIVRVIAGTLGLPLVSLRNIHQQWVGSSERNLERALWVLEALAPVVVWVDEIDQFIGGQRNTGQSADGGTSERLLARLMEFMGDHSAARGIVWVGTSNRPDVLDSAIEDRFPVTIPLIPPSAEEIADVLPALAAQQGRSLDADVDCAAIARSVGPLVPSMRTLVQLVERAGIAADARSARAGRPISQDDLAVSFADVRDRSDAVEKEFLSLTAIDKATFRSLLPWSVRSDWTPPPHLQRLLRRSDHGGWTLDEAGLGVRLQELARLRSERSAQR